MLVCSFSLLLLCFFFLVYSCIIFLTFSFLFLHLHVQPFLFLSYLMIIFYVPNKLCILRVKVSSRVKNHHFSKFAIFRRLNRAHQEVSFKKKSKKKCFFCADLWGAKVFSMLIILIDHWQVLSYLIRLLLLNQANHAIWQKSWFTSILCSLFFPGVWECCLQRRKKSLCVSSSTPRQKNTTKSFCR